MKTFIGRKTLTLALALGSALSLSGQALAEASVADYRAALADKDGNPGSLIIDKGEVLFKTPRGPKNATLEACDFGLGAGKLKGAFAQLPRYFKDTDRVQDVESRLLTCMVKLQGFDEAEIKKKLYADQRFNEDNTPLEAITAYVAAQSDGMALNPPMKHAKEKEAVKLGEALFWNRYGPMDFACATCHAQDDKRIRLQAVVNHYNKQDIQSTVSAWPTYRVSHGAVRTMQHRMWDCHWQMRLPDIDYGSPVAVAIVAFQANQARGVKFNLPGMKR
jgi:sulfur-oxidizing protein SoxA